MRRNASLDARDHGLTLISRINRWLIGGAVALTGVVSLIASQSFHGRTLGSRAPVSQRVSSSSSSGSGASSSAGSIQQPAQSPSPVPAPALPTAPVVSGGS